MLNREKRKFRFAEKAKMARKNGEIVICSWLRLCKSVENEGLGEEGSEWHAHSDSTTAAVTLRITNEDEGKSEVVTCLFRWRLVIITILSLSPNSDLFELLPRRVETLFSALFQSSENHVSFINFSITLSLSSLVETF